MQTNTTKKRTVGNSEREFLSKCVATHSMMYTNKV